MKTRSFKFISFLMTLAILCSLIPAAAVSAAGLDPVGLKNISIKVKNSDAYYTDGVNMYCLAGEKPEISAKITGLSEGNQYHFAVELYDQEGYYVTGDSYFNMSGDPYRIVLPKLSAGRYTIKYTFFGRDINDKSFYYSIFVMDKNAYNFCKNLFTAFDVNPGEKNKVYSYAYGLTADNMNARSAIRLAYEKSKLSAVSDSYFVESLYKGILQRDSDKGGYAYWMNEIKKNRSRESILSSFVNSKEFENDICKNLNIPW